MFLSIVIFDLYLKLCKFGNLQVKILIDLGVGFKDSTGKHKVILTKLLEMMYSVYRSLTKIQVNNNHT